MFYVFTMHFYITFGTNLLTQSLVSVPVFPLFQCFEEKEYQTESKRNETFGSDLFWNKCNLGDLEWTSRSSRGGHEAGGRALGGWARPPPSWAPRGSPDRLPSPIYIYVPQKHLGAPQKPIYTAATFCTREIPSWSLFRRSTGGGIDHGGLLHQHHSPSDEL